MFKRLKAEAPALLIIVVFFALFFWPATLAGRYFVGGDALVYSYPLRTALWQMVRHGQLPLWTEALLAGYPLLSMSQLAVGYPLTWFYLILPGYAAEQIYVLAPFLLAPIFTYLYARQIGRSRSASLLAGLSFGFGGMMASFIGTFGFLTNAVMWLPLTLVAIERARTRPFLRCLLLMTFSYVMAVLTGIGQGFLYVGIIAVAYSCVYSFAAPPAGGKSITNRLRPLAVCLIGMFLAIGVSAFQLLETMQAQRLSIRSKLSYEVFSAGGFGGRELWRSFMAPLYNYQEVTSFITLLVALLAIVAAAVWFKDRNWRVMFWLTVALAGLLLMLGDHTPLYRLVYALPLVNLFRVPSRHAFEWTFALAVLAAFGWDAATFFFADYLAKQSARRRMDWLIGSGIIAVCAITGFIWWFQTRPIDGAPVQHTGMPESAWLVWKLCFTLLILLAAVWGWRMQPSRQRSALLVSVVLIACFVEPYILLQRWWFHFAKPSSYFTQVSPPSQFLQKYAPNENRIYTSIAPGYSFDLPHTEPHNITARRGFQNAAGYEPLMSARYDKAFGNGGGFSTPGFAAPLDRQILNSNWQVLDLLNVRFLVEFSAAASTSGGSFTEKEGARFAVADAVIELKPKGKATLTGAAAPVSMDALTIVSTLANSGDLNHGQVVAQINLVTADGHVITHELQAGRDSAEWAHERPDVKATIQHPLAPVFDTVPGDGFPVHRFWSRFDLGEKLTVDRIEITNVTANASLVISKATAYDSSAAKVFLLTQTLPAQWRKVYDQDNVQIHENPRVLPRVWLVPKVEVVSEQEALQRIRGEAGQTFDSRQIALFDQASARDQTMPEGKFDQGEAYIINAEPNRLVIETGADAAAALVISETYYPGWEATIDGQKTTIYPTNYLLRGIVVPAGSHRVEMRYTAPAARIGGVISLLTLLLVAGLAVKARRTNNPIGGSKND